MKDEIRFPMDFDMEAVEFGIIFEFDGFEWLLIGVENATTLTNMIE